MVNASVLRRRFADRVREFMAAAGVEPSDLVTMSKLSAARLERILAGSDLAMKINDMDAIANALGVSLYSLLKP